MVPRNLFHLIRVIINLYSTINTNDRDAQTMTAATYLYADNGSIFQLERNILLLLYFYSLAENVFSFLLFFFIYLYM